MIVRGYRWLPALTLCAMSALFEPAAAAAQNTIGGGWGAFIKNDGKSDQPYLGPGYGGVGPSVLVFYLRDSGRRVTGGAEVLFLGTISGFQSQRISAGENRFMTKHRDVLMLGVAAFQGRPFNRIRLAAVAGGGLARRHTSRVGTTLRLSPTRVETPFSEVLIEISPVVGGGPNVVFMASDSVGIGALWRAHYVIDEDLRDDGVVDRGVSSFSWSFTLGIQITF